MSYRRAVEWIALNDNPGAGDPAATVETYLTTLLVADVFGKESADVARAVIRTRAREGLPPPGND